MSRFGMSSNVSVLPQDEMANVPPEILDHLRQGLKDSPWNGITYMSTPHDPPILQSCTQTATLELQCPACHKRHLIQLRRTHVQRQTGPGIPCLSQSDWKGKCLEAGLCTNIALVDLGKLASEVTHWDINVWYMPGDVRNDFVRLAEGLEIRQCARCGQDHIVERMKFTAPIQDDGMEWPHWAMCPILGEPILIHEVGEETVPALRGTLQA